MTSATPPNVLLVTGASRGLGCALALGFLQRGWRVAACAKHLQTDPPRGTEAFVAAGSFFLRNCDVGDEVQCQTFVADVDAVFGRIDVLVNNASMLGMRSRIEEYPSPVWDSVLRTNLNGVFHMTKAVIPIMRRQQSGSIINVSSSVGRTGRKTWGAYAVSKFAVEGITQVLADELKTSGITVNSVNPGAMATDMRAEAFPSEDPTTLRKPEETLDVYYYLASDSARQITGRAFDAQDFTLPGS